MKINLITILFKNIFIFLIMYIKKEMKVIFLQYAFTFLIAVLVAPALFLTVRRTV
jgi:hypothetical protein